jgi:hypothetical protein
MSNMMEVNTEKLKKLSTNVKKTNSSKENFFKGILKEEGTNSTEINTEEIKRYPVGTMVEIINHDKKWFLAMGINRISPIFDNSEDLQKFIEGDKIELICSIALTIATILINNQKN